MSTSFPCDPSTNGEATAQAKGDKRQAGGVRRVRTLEPYRPFPLDALAEPLRAYVAESAAALGPDPAYVPYVALPALAVVASVIGNSRAIALKRGWREPSVLWSGIIGESGALKSPAWFKAVGPLQEIQRGLFAAHKAAAKKVKEDRKGGAEVEDPEPAKRHLTNDITIEKLAQILEDNPRGVLVARDELAGWLGSFTRYKAAGAGSDLPNWLSMSHAGPVIIDRKTGERNTLFIPRAAVSVTGGIQPGTLARLLTPEFFDCGLVARLLMVMPPKRAKQWCEDEVSQETEESYSRLLRNLLALRFDPNEEGAAPRVLRLSWDAKTRWVRFYNEWAQEQAAAEGEQAAALAKLEGYAARLALIYHVVTYTGLDSNDCVEIGDRAVEVGITLARWFACEARRIYATLSETREQRDRRRLVEFIQGRGGHITVNELQRSNSRKYPTSDEAQAALEALEQDQLARWQEGPTPAQGGRRKSTLHLLPTSDVSDDRHQDDDDAYLEAPEEASDDRSRPPSNTGKDDQSSETSDVGHKSSMPDTDQKVDSSVERRAERSSEADEDPETAAERAAIEDEGT
jgi:hypothetical protein